MSRVNHGVSLSFRFFMCKMGIVIMAYVSGLPGNDVSESASKPGSDRQSLTLRTIS